MNNYEPLTIRCQGGLLKALAVASEMMDTHRKMYSTKKKSLLYFLRSASAVTGNEGTNWEIIYNVNEQQSIEHESAQDTFHG